MTDLQGSRQRTDTVSSAADFRALFEAELPFVLRALRRLGVREGDLPDVAQELFLCVFDRLGELDPAAPRRRWLYAFCVRFASNYRRLARHRAAPLDDTYPEPRVAGADSEARDLVLRGLDVLEFDQRVALVLHDLEGVTAPEIAILTETPMNTVYSRIRLARDAFRAAVEKLSQGGAS